MQKYFQFIFNVDDKEASDILLAELSLIGFDGFEEKENTLIAFINVEDFDENALKKIINQHQISFTKSIIKEQNWNALWEQNFQPVIVNKSVGIRASFHEPINDIETEIIITPKMSFGTGHHATTYMMLEQMSFLHLKNKLVLDFGTGTGVLAIYAEKLGAIKVDAIDNDEWSINNAQENIQQNNCNKINLSLTEKPAAGKLYDVVLANINKNIIIDNFEKVVRVLNNEAVILFSGLLQEDEADILQLAFQNNLKHIKTHHREKWICIKFQKNH